MQNQNIVSFNGTYSLFDLAFVCCDLLLQFLDGVSVLIVGLAIFFVLQCQVLETLVLLPHQLVSLLVSALFRLKLRLQLADSLFQFLDDLLAALQS
jgi:hypothetical protein